MAIRERFIYAIDVVTDGAKTGLSKFRQDIAGAEGAVGKLKAGWGSLTTAFAQSRSAQLAVGAAAVGAAKVAIDAASDLEESVNAVNKVYGDQAEAVLKVGEDSASSFGLAKSEFNEFAVQFSAFATQIAERDGRQVADVVEEMTTRVADFASVQNLDLEEAGRIVMSTLAGETEAFRRFGGDVSAATVEQYALENGLIASKGEMTEGVKVLARYGLFMEQTESNAGDFADTSDGLANSQKILRAQIKDLSAEIGSRLVPAAAAATSGLTDMLDVMEQLKLLDTAGFVQEWLTPIGAYNKAQEDSVRATVLQVESLDHLKGKSEELRAELERRGFSQEQINKIVAAGTETTEDATAATEDATEATEDQAAATEKAKRAEERREKAVDRAKAAQERSERALEEWNEAAREQYQRTQDLISAKQQLVGGDIAVREAQRRARDAVATYNEVLEDSEATAEDFAEAQDDAAQAMLDAARAAADNEIATREAAGEQISAGDKALTMRNRLRDLANTLDPGSALRRQLMGYINDLNAVPREIVTNLRTNQHGVRVGGGSSTYQQRASGGPTSPGQVYQVNERGLPELYEEGGKQFLLPAQNGQVTPLSPARGQPSGGGMTVHVTVNAGLGSNGTQIGREIVEVLNRYKRDGGKVPW